MQTKMRTLKNLTRSTKIEKDSAQCWKGCGETGPLSHPLGGSVNCQIPWTAQAVQQQILKCTKYIDFDPVTSHFRIPCYKTKALSSATSPAFLTSSLNISCTFVLYLKRSFFLKVLLPMKPCLSPISCFVSVGNGSEGTVLLVPSHWAGFFFPSP